MKGESTWDDATALEGVPDEGAELLVGDLDGAQVLDQLGEPDQDFLVGEAVKWAGETVQSGGEGEVWVGEGGADQVGGVGRDVATLVVRVNGHVQTHQLDELGVIVADHLAEVGRPVEALVNGWGGGLLAVQVVVDDGGDGGQVGEAVHAVLVDVLPVGGLVDTVVVSLE